MDRTKGSLELKQEVMDSGVCARCGLCAELCPYIKAVGERVALVYPCGLEEGNCYRLCPRTPTDWEQIDRSVFNRERVDHVLGNHLEILFARSLQDDAAEKGQYGGVVSALAAYLLEQGRVSGAVLAGGPAGETPQAVVATSRGEVLACAGSHYSAAPTLSAVHRAVKEGMDSLAVVGRPCQVLALRKMQGLKDAPGYLPAKDKVEFIIGLFCFWSLETEIYDLLSRRAGGQKILKVDIPQDFLTITTESGSTNIPIEEVRPFIRPTCQLCFDPTSEFADVSVGSTEYDPQWNTLIVRSTKGKEIVDAARAEGIIETKAYPDERLPLLYQAVRNKKLRVLQALESGQEAGYLRLTDQYRENLKRERGMNL